MEHCTKPLNSLLDLLLALILGGLRLHLVHVNVGRSAVGRPSLNHTTRLACTSDSRQKKVCRVEHPGSDLLTITRQVYSFPPLVWEQNPWQTNWLPEWTGSGPGMCSVTSRLSVDYRL